MMPIAERRARQRERMRRWRETHAEYNRARKRAFRRANPVSALLSEIRIRCRKRGLPFDLTHEDIVIPAVCPVLGIPLDGRDHDHKPSVDRVRPHLGYVRGNVQVISLRANRLKSDATPEELYALADYVRRCIARGLQ